MKIAIYPGTFDPVTNGHIDIVSRGCEIFDKLYVVVAINPNKKTIFTKDERINFLKNALKNYPNVEVVSSDELTVDCARRLGAKYMLRGLRAVSDFEYELQINAFNKSLAPDIETIYVMATNKYSFLSSSSIKEIASFGGDVTKFVPTEVASSLVSKLNK